MSTPLSNLKTTRAALEEAVKAYYEAAQVLHEESCDDGECDHFRGLLTEWLVLGSFTDYDSEGERRDFVTFAHADSMPYRHVLGLLAHGEEIIRG